MTDLRRAEFDALHERLRSDPEYARRMARAAEAIAELGRGLVAAIQPVYAGAVAAAGRFAERVVEAQREAEAARRRGER